VKTIALIAQKGGVGKTTLAVNLAVAAGMRTILFDLDQQESAVIWADRRQDDMPRVEFLTERRLSEGLKSCSHYTDSALGQREVSSEKLLQRPLEAFHGFDPLARALILFPVEQFRGINVRVQSEQTDAKIREHAMQKVPFQLVLGDREVEAHEVNVRVRGQEKVEGSVPVDAFVERVKKLIEEKSAIL
jgi:hypothetical protein